MFQFSDNEHIYVVSAPQKSEQNVSKTGRIAFGIMGEISALNAENSAQLDKIIASAKQNRANTFLANFCYTDISISQIQKSGVTALVVFANQIPEIFASLNVKVGMPFVVSGMAIFISPDLENLQKSTAAKMALWNFMKPQIG